MLIVFSMRYKFVHVHLTGPASENLKLTYEVRPHKLGQLWASSLAKALPSGMREQDRFYNFHTDKQSALEKILNKIDASISQLQKLHPELSISFLDRANVAASVNQLHKNFADSHLVAGRITPENMKLWSEFNVALHKLESFKYNEDMLQRCNFPMANIIFTWNDQQRTLIEDEDFSEFDVDFEFGMAYFCYAQVGRQIFEIFTARDADVPASHIQPARYFSADTLLWFGPNYGTWAKTFISKALATWYSQNVDLKKLIGLDLNDPKLSIGQVPVGRLLNVPYSEKEKKELIAKIGRFDTVSRIELEV